MLFASILKIYFSHVLISFFFFTIWCLEIQVNDIKGEFYDPNLYLLLTTLMMRILVGTDVKMLIFTPIRSCFNKPSLISNSWKQSTSFYIITFMLAIILNSKLRLFNIYYYNQVTQFWNLQLKKPIQNNSIRFFYYYFRLYKYTYFIII